MLKIRKRFLPHFSLSALATSDPQLSPVISEDDELIQDIENDSVKTDDNWTLSDDPDVEGLKKYWDTVEQDIANDPEWFHFAED